MRFGDEDDRSIKKVCGVVGENEAVKMYHAYVMGIDESIKRMLSDNHFYKKFIE